MRLLDNVRTIKTEIWWIVTMMMIATVMEVSSLNGSNVCMVKQKYNITKRVKYRAPMSVRTYEWCFSMPPRCSRWNTEMRDLTRLETEERTAEMAVCCKGYKIKDVSCVPICPHGKMGHRCSEDCPPEKWGPNCVHDCKTCEQGTCSSTTGECRCQDGWQGERCESSMSTTASVAMMEQLLTSKKSTIATKTSTLPTTTATPASTKVESTAITSFTTTPTTKLTTQMATTSTKKVGIITTTTTTQKPIVYYNDTQIISPTIQTYIKSIEKEETARNTVTNSMYNRTLNTLEMTKQYTTVKTAPKTVLPTTITTDIKTALTTTTRKLTSPMKTASTTTTPMTTALTTTTPKLTSPMILPTEASTKIEVANSTITTFKGTTVKLETTKKLETTVNVRPTTIKFKPKEIWIRPAQKGESTVETKVKISQEIPVKHKSFTKKETTENTTPKTIIVAIIPTSVSYASFKKIALSTASYIAQRNNITIKTYSKTVHGHTNSMTFQTTTPISVKTVNVIQRRPNTSTTTNPIFQNVTKTRPHTLFTTKGNLKTTIKTSNSTNSMSTLNANKRLIPSNSTTVSVSTTNVKNTDMTKSMTTPFKSKITTTLQTVKEQTTEPAIRQRNVTNPVTNIKTKTVVRKQINTNNSKRNLTTITVTDDPSRGEDTFHILTEPEHITAVMGDKGTERSSVDLISVISIAGGVMMAVITVAVVIVMLERCRRPRYEDVRKYNDIRMQVMINENNDEPPPYVRSIFHTPLPDPPTSEKCHYQPISTLDRNLKQFMRPVVVQTISPLMLENFRGILECHYDHLPRRSHDLGTMDTRCSIAPSIEEREELLCHRAHSLTDSDIEALKCEAKLDVIDSTTSEPLYAEIPCWRPPSEHAIEVVNLNGEAVTEL